MVSAVSSVPMKALTTALLQAMLQIPSRRLWVWPGPEPWRDAINEVICVIGDGALTGGMAYEALNDAGQSGENNDSCL